MFKSNYGKAIALILCLLLTVAFASVGCKKQQEEPIPTETPAPATEAPDVIEGPTAEPTAEPLPDFEGNALPMPDGAVCAIATGTYGVATDGSVRYMGMSVTGQHYFYDWEDVVRLAASDNTTVALLADGTLRMTGTHAEDFAEAMNWTDLVDIAVGKAHLVGLRADGTVCAVGNNASRQCEVSGWQRVTAIYACGDFTVGITDAYGEGVLDTLHPSDYPVEEGERYIAAGVAPDRIALLTDAGRVVSFEYGTSSAQKEDKPLVGEDLGWQDIVKVCAAEGAVYGVDSTGTLHANSDILNSTESMTEEIRLDGVYSVSASANHFVMLYADGTAAGLGADDYLQCELGVWRLMPYVTEEGYLLGYSEGDTVNGELYRTGLELNIADPITGEQRTAVAVLLGDINGDGAIDSADGELMDSYRSGDTELDGAFLRAANIIDDDAAPGAVDRVDSEALAHHLDGSCPIDQYAKKDMYTTPLANAKRVNTDAVGYIAIDGTNINYPIMYGDNWYYHTRGLDRGYLERGSLYFYWSRACKNIVLTGHNARTSGTMFHQLHYIQNRSSELSTYANRLWCINAYGETGYWEVWAMYEEGTFANANDSSLVYNTTYPRTMESMSEQELQGWIFYQLDNSELNYKINVSTEDRFMTVVTCGDTHAASEKGSRLYFFLRWVSGN